MASPIGKPLGRPARSIDEAQRSLQQSLSRLGSARRIQSGADDAAGLAISDSLRASERALQQGIRNLSDGVSLVQTAEGGLRESAQIVGRLRELSVQSQNGTLNDTGRAAIQNEFDQLTGELTRIAQSTRFGSTRLLSGDVSGERALTVRDGTGPDGGVQVSIRDVSAEGLGLRGLQAQNGETLDELDRALATLSSTRAELGSAQSRLGSSIENLRASAESTEAARSRIADTDVAEATAEKTRSQIALDASTASQTQANVSVQAALSLLS